jgi:S1-C subfamily serine protease
VFAGGPAARAGLQAGDVVYLVGGKRVNDVDEVQLAVSLLPPDAATTIGYERNGQAATTQLTLAKLAAAGKNIVSARPESWRGMRVDYPTALDAVALTQAIASGAYAPEGCVLVSDVEVDSDAWKAGIRKGMFVSHVGKKRVSTPAEFQAATRNIGKSFDVRLTKPIEEPGEPAQLAPKKPE